MADKKLNTAEMSDKDLEKLRADLNDQKVAIKTQEREIDTELTVRRALALAGIDRKIVKITLEGGIAPQGETNGGKN